MVGRVTRIRWEPVIERAAEVAAGALMTLRQCFYILVSEGAIPNTDTSYKRLSSLTAEGRREGSFPSFLDGTREIVRYRAYEGVEDAIGAAVRVYRRDRTEGQEAQVWIAGEKRTLAAQLERWFGDLGCPIVVCAGYSSQTLCDDVRAEIAADQAADKRDPTYDPDFPGLSWRQRPAVLIYAGDFDPSGEDIARDFIDRVGAFDEVVRVAVTSDQVAGLGLPPQPGKATDSRAAGFIARHGSLVQVEVEAVHPETLRQLYQDAVDRFWDVSAYDAVCVREESEREALRAVLERFEGDE